MKHLPVETRFEGNSHLDCKLSNLDYVVLYEVGKLFPGGGAILPSATNEPALCRLRLAGGTVECDLLLV